MFIGTGLGGGPFDQVQVGLWTDAEPGMFAIVEGFRDGIESDHQLVKAGAGFQVNYMVGDMVDHGLGLCLKACAGNNKSGSKEKSDGAHTVQFEWEGNG